VYQVPAGSGIRLHPGPLGAAGSVVSSHLHVLGAPAGDEGISIWDVERVLVDPCRSDGPVSPLEPGPAALLAHLRSVDRLIVEDAGPVTIDARPASRIDLMVAGEASGCPDEAMYLWREPDGGGAIAIHDHETVRLIVLDVDQATIAIEIWSRLGVEAWQPTADGIIRSIRFLHQPSAP
jgi:hypothetical protein